MSIASSMSNSTSAKCGGYPEVHLEYSFVKHLQKTFNEMVFLLLYISNSASDDIHNLSYSSTASSLWVVPTALSQIKRRKSCVVWRHLREYPLYPICGFYGGHKSNYVRIISQLHLVQYYLGDTLGYLQPILWL